MAARSGLAMLGLLLALAACATPKPAVYGPITDAQPYGYRDRSNGDGGYTVLAVVPAYSSPAEARAFWDRRAEELCPAGLSKRIVFRSERKELMPPPGAIYGAATVGSRITQRYEVEGYAYCKTAPSGG